MDSMDKTEGLIKELNECIDSLQDTKDDLLELLTQLQKEYERQAKEFKI